ncbi:MAG: pyruvate kinase [Candidatus Methanolliviera hydrocarbonicum]|uniref:Pyruvate kinase n=1 Tax=Candidatus Methanolliviera hydrocarbonicum TaxID=2491085 RepID=A0A520KYR1_9EURY|nr:MAG: pyruvate kinase [Candidatus Methanolliviera hydrocarbonicum]
MKEMRKTKIICTIGPASSHKEVIKDMIGVGMDVARLNFSHGTHEQHKELILKIRETSEDMNKETAILQDLSGPKIRIGVLKKPIKLKSGSIFTLTKREMIGDGDAVSVNYPALLKNLNIGDLILMNDGSIELNVVETGDEDVKCKVLTGGVLFSHKGLNIPTSNLNIPALTKKDREDLRFGIKNGVDMVAVSFVHEPSDFDDTKEVLKENGSNIPIIAKIETQKALENIDGILDRFYGIMVARGDLGVETPFENIPIIQKELIEKARFKGKPVAIATQMLRSMVEQPRPDRAEVTDVASAVSQGADAMMLSEETAMGRYPVESVRTMSKIAEAMERRLSYEEFLIRGEEYRGKNILDAISHTASLIASDLNAKAILAPTRSGTTARMVARHRPIQPIVAVSSDLSVVRRLNLSWGVYPFVSKDARDPGERMEVVKKVAIDAGFVKKGDLVVITSGPAIGTPGTTNLIKAEVIK